MSAKGSKSDATKALKAKFLESLNGYRGIVLSACEAANVSRSTYYHWLNTDAEFKKRVEEITENQLDFVESKLLDNIKKGDTTSIIFYLKTKGKKRGYTERDSLKEEAKNGTANVPALTEKGKGMEGNEKDFTENGKEKVSKGDKNGKKNRKSGDSKVEAKKRYIVKMLKKQGKYTAELTYQVEITARLLVHADALAEEVNSPDFNPITIEKSREGNARESVSAKERLYLETLRQAQRSLAALGMNTDSRQKMEKNDDSFNEFMEEFKEG